MNSVLRSMRQAALAASFVLLPVAGFAQLPASSPSRPAVPDRVAPPIPLGNPRLVLSAPFADTIYDVNVRVEIEANGKADLNTLELSGSAGEFNRKAITDWLKATSFRPGKRNGIPERSTFRMSAEALKQADVPDSTSSSPR